MNIVNIPGVTARKFFGLESATSLGIKELENLLGLKTLIQKEIGFADLGWIKDSKFSDLFSQLGIRPASLSEFKETGLATLTLMNPEFAHPATHGFNSHTIGLAVNKNPNQHFYPSEPEILILDSLGNSYPGAKKIHEALTRDFLKKLFPDSRVTITSNPQQTDGSITCLNWTLANLKTVRENMGRADILNLLPKSFDLQRILDEQQRLVQLSRQG